MEHVLSESSGYPQCPARVPTRSVCFSGGGILPTSPCLRPDDVQDAGQNNPPGSSTSWLCAENKSDSSRTVSLSLTQPTKTHQSNHLIGRAISDKFGWSRLSVCVYVVDLQQPVDWPPKRWSDGCPAAALVVGVPLLELVLVVRGHLHRSEEAVSIAAIILPSPERGTSEKLLPWMPIVCANFPSGGEGRGKNKITADTRYRAMLERPGTCWIRKLASSYVESIFGDVRCTVASNTIHERDRPDLTKRSSKSEPRRGCQSSAVGKPLCSMRLGTSAIKSPVSCLCPCIRRDYHTCRCEGAYKRTL